MTPDNQDLQKGDRVELLIPEFTPGTTGVLMRSCSNDCVVVAIDRLPTFQCRINVSRFLVRKVREEIKASIEELEHRPTVSVMHGAYGVSFFNTSNVDAPDVSVDWEERTLTIDDAYPSLAPESVEDLVITLRTAAQMLIKGEKEW